MHSPVSVVTRMRRDEARALIDRFVLEDVVVHATDYDPQKRHEYYLRKRELKGRDKAAAPPISGASRPAFKFSTPVVGKGVIVKNDAHARQQAISVRVGQLKERLGQLKDRLEQLRKEARKKDEGKSSGEKKPSSDTKSSGSTKDQKPLTEAQKREKAKAERDRYKKENPQGKKDASLPKTEKELLAEIQKVESKIRAIIAEARKQQNKTDS